MPELPEVETIRRGLIQSILGRKIEKVIIRNPRLRWPIAEDLADDVPGHTVKGISRRGKYLLFHLTQEVHAKVEPYRITRQKHAKRRNLHVVNEHSEHVFNAVRGYETTVAYSSQETVILHLGMSGSLRVVPVTVVPEKHDHVDLVFDGGDCLRFRDPRRFGAIFKTSADPLTHPLLADLGPEPLGDTFSGEWLFKVSRNRRVAVKAFLMEGKVVVGLGNIYANEALFRAAILPSRPAGSISLPEYDTLAEAIRQTLQEAVDSGGTTLRDFFHSDGEPGYFRQRLCVYGRTGEPCPQCGRPIEQQRICQRSSFFCSHCQR